MITNRKLPDSFLELIKSLEESYLATDDPIRQSGFSGGPERWRLEREPILEAIETDGELLDIGCANGFLLECLRAWGGKRGIKLTPFGLDYGAKLIELAKRRLPEYRSNFYVGNAWDWRPPEKYRYVYTLYDCVPLGFLEEYVERLLSRVVCPGGRLIIGAYGSRSQDTPPFDIKSFLKSHGFSIAGTVIGGDPPVTSFAWLDR
ncbi:MAG: class I SAM-dependent methyltransferase [candidate division Zixibacteria bacterium]|nr:class I SAM-dependent methyltransferase [candidate division Zixibacteria bacterium]